MAASWLSVELSVEERNLLSVAHKNAAELSAEERNLQPVAHKNAVELSVEILIMQVLRDSLTLWTSEEDRQADT